MEPQQKGDLTELLVATELKRRGIPVSKPLGDNERYDLAIETPNGSLLRIQVKTGWTENGTILLKGKSQHTNASGNTYKKYDSDDIDYYIVYLYENELMYLVDSSLVESGIRLRLREPTQNCSSVNWATSFEFDTQWPVSERQSGRPQAITNIINSFESHGCEVFEHSLRDNEFVVTGENTTVHVAAIEATRSGDSLLATPGVDSEYYGIWAPENNETYLVHSDEFTDTIHIPIDRCHSDPSISATSQNLRLSERWPPEPMPTVMVQNSAVLEVIDLLHESNWHVVPEPEDHKTLHVSRDGLEYRIRVSTGRIERGCIRVSKSDVAVDYYIVNHSSSDSVYLLSNDTFDRTISLRLDDPQQHDATINWASDFDFEDTWPPDG